MRTHRLFGGTPTATLALRALQRSEWDQLERLARRLVPHLAAEITAARMAAEAVVPPIEIPARPTALKG
jgi:hypothetical protein